MMNYLSENICDKTNLKNAFSQDEEIPRPA
jgi:hypothetical protein